MVVQRTVYINGGTLVNRPSGLATNSGTININACLLSSDSGADFRNLGIVVNDANSTFDHDGYATLDNLGTFINHDTFTGVQRGGDVTHRGDGLWVNIRSLIQAGVGDFNIWSGARLENSGHLRTSANEFDLHGVIENAGTLEVGGLGTLGMVGALIENRAGARLINGGVLSISISSASTIARSVINNVAMSSAGSVNNDCGGTFTGTISGNQPSDVWTAS